jgi:ElaB/YqjD/DUF883 family membrane-anchored ribosome-binding protein
METTDKLREDLRLVASDVEELLKATAGQTGERVSAARERVEASLRSAGDKLEDAGHAAAARARRAAEDTDRYVHVHPWTSIGAATGVGLLIGYVLGRR